MDGSSYSDLEASFSWCSNPPAYSSYSKNYRRGSSYTAIPSLFVDDTADEKPRHFLDACALCCMPLPPNRDIFMYRGNMPFCSQECRQEQIEIDEGTEERQQLSAKNNSAVVKGQKSKVTGRHKSHDFHHRDGTAVAC